MLRRVITQFEGVGPAGLVEIAQHFLLKLVLAVINRDRVVKLIQAVSLCNAGWSVQVSNIRGGLARLCPRHHHLLVDGAECVNHDPALH